MMGEPPQHIHADINKVEQQPSRAQETPATGNETQPIVQAPVVEPPKVEPQRKIVESPSPRTVTGTKTDWLIQAGIPESEWNAVDYIVQKESSWNYRAVNRSSGATGLCQSLPASKMASAGGDYLTNPVTQLKWCHSYAHSRYGGWWAAHSFWVSNHWW